MAGMGNRVEEVEAARMTTLPLLTPAIEPSLEECLARAFPGLAKTASGIMGHNPLTEFDEGAFFAPSTLAILLEQDDRLPGIRDELTPEHAVVLRLMARLEVHSNEVPEPDSAMAERLASFGKVEFQGKICLLDGVPIPAGEAQLPFFVVMRWRPLFHPNADIRRVYCGDEAYDRLVATDILQEPVLNVTTRQYRNQLGTLQRRAPDLFVAIWFRRFRQAEEILMAYSDAKELVTKFFAAPMTCGESDQLLLAASIMSEWERIFEIADAMKLDGRNEDRITRESVQKALDAAQRWDDILALEGEIGLFLRGCALHVRANHRSMNFVNDPEADTCMLARVREALDNSLVFQDRYRRVEMIDRERPVRFFAGVELAKFIPVMLEQMHDSLMQHRVDGGKVALVHKVTTQRRRKQMLLSIVALSNICGKTARHITRTLEVKQGNENAANAAENRSRADALTPREWRKIYLSAIVIGVDPLGRDADKLLLDLVGPQTKAVIVNISGRIGNAFKNKLNEIGIIASECTPSTGEYGWTMGGRFDAWLKPDAEVEFLRNCTTHVKYREELDIKARQWEKVLSRRACNAGQPINPLIRPISLPRAHPLEHTHESLPSIFEPLQFTDVIGSAAMSRRWLMREQCVRQAGLRLAALSPITDDPWLSERNQSRPSHRSLAKNSRRRGTFQNYQIAITRDLFWQR